jgi:hypothetical protein
VADPISSAHAKTLLIPCNLSLKPIPNGLDEEIATMDLLIVGETGTTTRILARIPDIQLIKKILVPSADLETIAAEELADADADHLNSKLVMIPLPSDGMVDMQCQ